MSPENELAAAVENGELAADTDVDEALRMRSAASSHNRWPTSRAVLVERTEGAFSQPGAPNTLLELPGRR